MTAPLDSKFLKVVALMRSTQHGGERASARARAEAMAAAAGMTLDEAISVAEAPVATPFVNIMSGFDDMMEREEPGWKARRAAEKAEAERQRLERRAAILDRYGSEDTALAPCPKEQLLQDALGARRKCRKPPYERWTDIVDGYWNCCDKPPAAVLRIIAQASPLPTTFSAAMAEYRYWEARQQEIEDVLGPGNYGDSGLDLVPSMRFDMVRNLVEHELETTTLEDLYARFKFYRDMEVTYEKIDAALFRDLETLVHRQHLSDPSTRAELDRVAAPEFSPIPATTSSGDPSTRNGQIRAKLDADPSRSDRAIAREVGCSPTTVGKVRAAMGLSAYVRSVQRGGQAYEFRTAARSDPAPTDLP